MRPFLTVLAGALALALSVNAAATWEDARRDERLRAAAAGLRPGFAMVFDGYVDERRLQEARLAVIPRPRVVAFGSSRVREVSTAIAGAAPGDFYNLGMSAAAAEDYVALWSLLKRRGAVPEVAVFSADAWALSRTHDPARWLALAREVDRFEGTAGGHRAWLHRPLAEALYRWYQAKELLSFTVLRSSVRDLERMLTGRKRRGDDLLGALSASVVPEAAGASRNAIRADGSVIRPVSPTDPTARQVHDQVVRDFTTAPYGLADFEWSPERAARLELLWRDMRAANVRLVAYMPPYHPAAWDILRRDPRHARTLRDTAAFLSGLAERMGGRFVDASDPASIPCAEEEFHDGQHASPVCLGRLWARLLP